MAEMFWVQCPEHEGRLYCHTKDLWDQSYDLLYPYCGETFTQEVGAAGLKSGGRKTPPGAPAR